MDGRGNLRVSVDDDGSGMPARVRRGMGLDNMHQRLRELDGTLQIRRRKPHGTVIVARLPLHEPEQQP